MDTLTSFFGLFLFGICVAIIGIFLADFRRFDKKTEKVKRPGKAVRREQSITYKVRYKGNVLQEGSITMDELPVQFGRAKGGGNDIIIAPENVAVETLQAISHTWFYIQKDVSGYLTVYSADAAVNGRKKTAAKPKLVVLRDGEKKAEHAVRLDSEVILKAKDLLMILSVEE